MRRLMIGLLVIGVFALVGFGLAWLSTTPEAIATGTESASRLIAGPYSVGRMDFEWTDASRATPRNGEFVGAKERRLMTSLWYPQSINGPHPLAVFSHGLMSSRLGCTYIAEHLASYGYVVASADHPLSHADALGGPNHLDVVNQPADLSFLIDEILALADEARPFQGSIAAKRIGVFGISLGGNTATLTAFHPEWRDPRIAAAVSIVGHGDVFGARFFEHASIPFLMIAGTADAIVGYEINAKVIPERITRGGLLTIEGATHAGFTHVTAGFLRVFGNPDNLGCSAASPDDIPQEQNPFVGLFGTPEQGLITPLNYRPPCATTYEDVMRAGRQQDIATLAVRAFLGSEFANTPEERASNRTFLETTLPAELEEVTYTPAGRRPIAR